MIMPKPYLPWHQRRILGWRLDALTLVLVLLGLTLWDAWLTHEITKMQQRRVVSVSLQSLVGAYIEATAREGLSEAEAQARTKAYLAAVEAAVASLNDGRTTVLVSEAVLGRTVPDVTEAVEAAVAKALAASPQGGRADGR